MFTGIIEEIGEVASMEPRQAGMRLRVRCTAVMEDAKEGSSISVNGVCLTVVKPGKDGFEADIAPETLRASNLGDLLADSRVNLERPVSVSSRMDGHIVQGHVDGTGELLALEEMGGGNWWLQVRVPPDLEKYLVYKGSIAIDGISLTVASIRGDILCVAIIPHTYENTSLATRVPGDRLNLECDVVAKYVEKMFGRLELPQSLTLEKLKEMGY